MIYLFTEDYEKSTTYRRLIRDGGVSNPPETKLDIVKRIWEYIIPHRSLLVGAGRIDVTIKDMLEVQYNASEMSDGERVIFYLIGQALAAPINGIIVIDEPELHLHKSIQTTLWREIEAARPDCLFVYITHDVEFASSFPDAKKIWLRGFNGKFWQWEEIQSVDGFPEDLLIELLGSRRSIIFVEGENGSYDSALFQLLYPHHFVVPRGSCEQVINATKYLRTVPQFHHLEIHGIIDRDRRTQNEVISLAKNGITVLDVVEVENLFCTPEILRLIADHLEYDYSMVMDQARKLIFDSLTAEIDNQVLLHTMSELQFSINGFGGNVKDIVQLKTLLDDLFESIDVIRISNDIRSRFDLVVQNRDYEEALKIYNRKRLASRMSGIFNLKEGELPNLVLRLARGKDKNKVIAAFKSYIPQL